MGYGRNNYRRGARSATYTTGRATRVNARPGPCRDCQEEIPAGAGQLYREAGGKWSVVHVPASQGGWLMHPQPVRGGCPESTDKRNAELYASGFLGQDVAEPPSERENIAATARTYAADHPASEAKGGNGVHYGYNSRGRSRCEDAPCCGCCD